MKDAKGHGSEKRGGTGTFKRGMQDFLGSQGATTHGAMGRSEFASQPAPQGAKFQARQAMKAANNPDSWAARYGTQTDRDRLRAEAINSGVDAGFSSARHEAGLAKVVSIAAQHGIPTSHLSGGPHKVQTLALGHSGQPWATQKAYRNRVVAERVAQYMRTDGGYTRVKTK